MRAWEGEGGREREKLAATAKFWKRGREFLYLAHKGPLVVVQLKFCLTADPMKNKCPSGKIQTVQKSTKHENHNECTGECTLPIKKCIIEKRKKR